MQITIALPDNLPLTEADVRIELAIGLYHQHSLSLDRAAQLAVMSLDDFYQLLIALKANTIDLDKLICFCATINFII